MKSSDKASPKLYNGMAAQPSSGSFSHKSCMLTTRKAGKDQHEYMQVTLQNITVSTGSDNPSESVSRTASASKPTYDVKANVKV